MLLDIIGEVTECLIWLSTLSLGQVDPGCVSSYRFAGPPLLCGLWHLLIPFRSCCHICVGPMRLDGSITIVFEESLLCVYNNRYKVK